MNRRILIGPTDGLAVVLIIGVILASGCFEAGEASQMSNTESTQRNAVSSDRTLPGRATTQPATVDEAVAMFGAGCFWGVEGTFQQVPGVISTAVGYSGGSVKDPGYRKVCSGTTGHAEVVQVVYDPKRVSYEQLLDVFWGAHDPTTLNRQGPDVGTQYRSAIFYYTPEQKAAAEASKAKQTEAKRFRRPIVTEITAAAAFYRAEEYHQRYLEKRGMISCPSSGH
jgi:peptide-methionine (S)-S-oxide reductase